MFLLSEQLRNELLDLLSKLGAWGLWERVERGGGGRGGERRKLYSSIETINLKKKKLLGPTNEAAHLITRASLESALKTWPHAQYC